ncbi:lsm14 protein [Moniliophthora roreri MCA 2997]|uniref:Lsm14 protein n=1 Tax=Moniliophthora roreri (strain MCA 2997) TaxID=1381753 RepID=V2WKT3_MONRO|nr:lsm14 protein [Moniliophthora roreri MCA 2997]
MALSFIGKPISLISHSDVRYRGILAGIDAAASTIQLSKVFSMGTETRRPASEYIPPVADPYEYIIFRASEVKDLAVEEPTPQPPVRNVHDDPAVIGVPNPAAAVAAAAYAQQQQQQQQAQQQRAAQQAQIPPRQQQPTAAQVVAGAAGNAPRAQPPRRNNAGNIQTAAASLETVERALGDLRVSNANAARGGAGGRRGNHAGPKPISVPNTDFDFESSNARFDKRALGASAKGGAESDVETNPSDNEEGKEKDKGKVRESTAYHPQKSFFDELTPGPAESRGGGRGGRRGGGPGGRNRREEERERNFATFGEAGGVGLMGPGAYVGGWGGYGRRGGRGGGVRGGRGRGRGGSAPVGVGAG